MLLPSPPGGPVVSTAPPPADAKAALVLPPFGVTATSDPAKATALAHKAIRAMIGLGEGNDDGFENATAAVLADPGSSYARYAVACASHDEAFATAQLQLLIDAKGCDGCVEDLRNVLSDTACPWTPAQRALAGTVRPSPQRAALDAILAALASTDRGGAKRYFTGAHVTSHFACSNCSDASHDRRSTGAGPKVFAAIAAILAEDDQYHVPLMTGDRFRRDGDCFTVDRALLTHNHVFFDTLCFAHGTTNVTSIELVDG